MSRSCYLLWIVLAALCCGACRQSSVQTEKAGIAISFDDRFIADWHNLRPLLNEYQARVTFYITGDTLSDIELSMLRDLASDGHEIGFHGTVHGNARELVANHGPDGYLGIEIRPGLDFLRKKGFNPTTYAHPGGTRSGRSDSVLFANGFVTLREVSKAERYLGGIRLYHIPPAWMPHIYYDFDHRGTLFALQIDRETELSEDEISAALEKAKTEGKVLMLFGHQPLPENPAPEQYGFRVDFLRYILQEAHARGLHFYTMSELQ